MFDLPQNWTSGDTGKPDLHKKTSAETHKKSSQDLVEVWLSIERDYSFEDLRSMTEEQILMSKKLYVVKSFINKFITFYILSYMFLVTLLITSISHKDFNVSINATNPLEMLLNPQIPWKVTSTKLVNNYKARQPNKSSHRRLSTSFLSC